MWTVIGWFVCVSHIFHVLWLDWGRYTDTKRSKDNLSSGYYFVVELFLGLVLLMLSPFVAVVAFLSIFLYDLFVRPLLNNFGDFVVNIEWNDKCKQYVIIDSTVLKIIPSLLEDQSKASIVNLMDSDSSTVEIDKYDGEATQESKNHPTIVEDRFRKQLTLLAKTLKALRILLSIS